MKMTLLENLCKVNNCQGGTIHQFCNILDVNFERFARNYKEFAIDMSFEFNTKKAFYKLAENANYTGLLF